MRLRIFFDTEGWAQLHEAPSTTNSKRITLSSHLSVFMLTDHHWPLGFMNGSQPPIQLNLCLTGATSSKQKHRPLSLVYYSIQSSSTGIPHCVYRDLYQQSCTFIRA